MDRYYYNQPLLFGRDAREEDERKRKRGLWFGGCLAVTIALLTVGIIFAAIYWVPTAPGGTHGPTVAPTPIPTGAPTTATPTVPPSAAPTRPPTAGPTAGPSSAPSLAPSGAPSTAPSAAPTGAPTSAPTAGPTASPTILPTQVPTAAPTIAPSAAPSTAPTSAPTALPTAVPTNVPSAAPTGMPSAAPTTAPTGVPSTAPTTAPTGVPSTAPTTAPTGVPTAAPTGVPSAAPTTAPTGVPSTTPSATPTAAPTGVPSTAPTAAPTVAPTTAPSAAPTAAPSAAPTAAPTATPTSAPTPTPDPCLVCPDMTGVGNFTVLAASGITNTGSTVIIGSIGSHPTGTITGFPPGTYTGSQHNADAAALAAQTGASALRTTLQTCNTPCNTTEDDGDLGGSTLVPGSYCFATSVGITGTLTLDAQGNQGAQFRFFIGTTLITASSSVVTLTNSAQPCNVFWDVGTSATLGTSSDIKGVIIADQSITATTSAVVTGRLFALNAAVTLDTNTVTTCNCTMPAPPTAAPTGVPSAAPTVAPTAAPTVAPTAAPSAAPTTAPTAAPTGTPTAAPTIPPGFCIAFTTSGVYNGSMGGIYGTDALCQMAANAATNANVTGHIFRAWTGSAFPIKRRDFTTQGEFADARLRNVVQPYVTPTGQMVAPGGLVDWAADDHSGPMLVDENGMTITSNFSVWTNVAFGALGSDGYSTCATSDVFTYGEATGLVSYLVGDARLFTNSEWTNDPVEAYGSLSGPTAPSPGQTGTCASLNRLYCLQQDCFDMVRVPPSLTSAPNACMAFATSTFYQGGMLGSPEAASALCNVRAANSSLSWVSGVGPYWYAWLSNATHWPANTFNQSTTRYSDVANNTIADSWADLTDGTLDAPIQYDEFGLLADGNVRVWTGTGSDGVVEPGGVTQTCGNWQSTGTSAQIGSDQLVNDDWTEGGSAFIQCASFYRLYCFQQNCV